MKKIRLIICFFIVLLQSVYCQNFINSQDALNWINKNLKSNTFVPIRQQTSSSNFIFSTNFRYFKSVEINNSKLILERYDYINNKPTKVIYELPLNKIKCENIQLAIEKYSRNICLIFKLKNKISVTKINNNHKQHFKRKIIIIEFNKSALHNNIPSTMQNSFQYIIRKYNNSSILYIPILIYK